MNAEQAAMEAIADLKRSTTLVQMQAKRLDELEAKGDEWRRENANLKQLIEGVAARADQSDRDLAIVKANAVSRAQETRENGPASVMKALFVSEENRHAGTAVDDLNLFTRTARHTYAGGEYTSRQMGLLNCDETYGPDHYAMKTAFEAAVLFGIARYGEAKDAASVINNAGRALPQAFHFIARTCRKLGLTKAGDREFIERIFGNTSGTGGDWIPDSVVLPELERAVGAIYRTSLAGMFMQKTLLAKNAKNPVISNNPRPFLAGGASATTAGDYLNSTPSTSIMSWDPKLFACVVIIDTDAEFDSIINAMAEVRSQVGLALTYGLDDAIINGDTAGQDHLTTFNPAGLFATAGAGGALDHRKAFLGLRARAIDIGANAKVDASTLAITSFGTAMGKLNDGCGADPEGMAWLMANEAYFTKVATLSEVLTFEKYGADATIMTGNAPRLLGAPVVRTPFLAKSAGCTGAFTTGGVFSATLADNTKHVIQLVARNRFIVGRRSNLEIVNETNNLNGTAAIIAKMRADFRSPDHIGALGSTSTVNTVMMYNIG